MSDGIREYSECIPVEIGMRNVDGEDRKVIRAYNQCGNDCVEIDLLDLLEYIAENCA
jgi:hypothetical protein